MYVKPWDGLIPVDDLKIIEGAGYGARMDWGKRPALVVVDATRSFLGDRDIPIAESIRRWPNACGPQAWGAIDAISTLILSAHTAAVPVFYTIGGFREDGFNLGSWLWKQPRSREDAESATVPAGGGNEIVPPLRPEPRDVVITKLKPSGFFETTLRSLLQLHDVDTLVVTGGTTSGCVRGTVLDAFSHNLRTIVPHECCFDRIRVSHAVSLFDMNAKYADVAPLDDVTAYFRNLDRDKT